MLLRYNKKKTKLPIMNDLDSTLVYLSLVKTKWASFSLGQACLKTETKTLVSYVSASHKSQIPGKYQFLKTQFLKRLNHMHGTEKPFPERFNWLKNLQEMAVSVEAIEKQWYK